MTRWPLSRRRRVIGMLALLAAGPCLDTFSAGKKEQRSPDGRFAAVHVSEDDGSENANGHVSLVALPSRRVIAPHFMIDVGVAEQLWWAPDSKRFAIYARPGTRIGATTVYERKGDKFVEIEPPEIEEAWNEKREEAIAVRTAKMGWEEARATRRIEDYVKPLRWLSSDALVLELRYINIFLKEGTDVMREFQARCEVVVTFSAGEDPPKIRSWGPITVSTTD